MNNNLQARVTVKFATFFTLQLAFLGAERPDFSGTLSRSRMGEGKLGHEPLRRGGLSTFVVPC